MLSKPQTCLSNSQHHPQAEFQEETLSCGGREGQRILLWNPDWTRICAAIFLLCYNSRRLALNTSVTEPSNEPSWLTIKAGVPIRQLWGTKPNRAAIDKAGGGELHCKFRCVNISPHTAYRPHHCAAFQANRPSTARGITCSPPALAPGRSKQGHQIKSE